MQENGIFIKYSDANCNFNYSPYLNKRHSWRGVNLPSNDNEPQGGEIVVAIDTSCSVSQDELNIFATETQNLCEECGINKIRVTYCDTSIIKNPTTGEWWDEFDLDN